jgi:protocatechuate 3,4-dioxygenase alpha subunit
VSATPGQTIGPFFGYSLPFAGGPELVPPGRPDAVRLTGTVVDAAGDPMPDALLELWQAGSDGQPVQLPGSLHRDGWTFTGWGRAATDATGRYSFTTIRPGAPFFAVTLFARGLLDRLFTRAYLPGDHPWPAAVPETRRHTLTVTVDGPATFVFDIRLGGPDETVFLRFDQTDG